MSNQKFQCSGLAPLMTRTVGEMTCMFSFLNAYMVKRGCLIAASCRVVDHNFDTFQQFHIHEIVGSIGGENTKETGGIWLKVCFVSTIEGIIRKLHCYYNSVIGLRNFWIRYIM